MCKDRQSLCKLNLEHYGQNRYDNDLKQHAFCEPRCPMHVRWQPHYLHRFFQLQFLFDGDILNDVNTVVQESNQKEYWESKFQDETNDVFNICWIRKTLDLEFWDVIGLQFRRGLVNYLPLKCVLNGYKSLLKSIMSNFRLIKDSVRFLQGCILEVNRRRLILFYGVQQKNHYQVCNWSTNC